MLLAYTLSKSFSNTDSAVSSSNVRGLNQFNPDGEWSVARDDRTHVLSISQVYELPIGPGKKILNHGGTFMKNLVGGWAISGHYDYASGTPVKITVNGTRPTGFHHRGPRQYHARPFQRQLGQLLQGIACIQRKQVSVSGRLENG